MFRSCNVSAVVCVLLLCMTCCGMSASKTKSNIFRDNMSFLTKTPKVYDCPDVQVLGDKAVWYEQIVYTPELRAKDAESAVKTIYYDSVPFQGKPTRVFAYLGMPKVPKGTKVPGIVLVHGGGGSAFESWVRLWNARGYAAIAMDTCGTLPVGSYGAWKRNEYGGAMDCGGFYSLGNPTTDQWTYQAVSSVVIANSLLRSQPGVDPKRIGITGVSWGGYLTCIASGVDNRFVFSAPVYGCGFLGDNSAWLPTFKDIGKEKTDKWLSMWDPSVYLPDAAMPMFWITGSQDFAYPMDSYQKSYRLPTNSRTLCIKIDMVHGHGYMSEIPEEIHTFANTYCLQGTPLAKITSQGFDDGFAWARFRSDTKIVSAKLNYTKDTGTWSSRSWVAQPAAIIGNKVSAWVPASATAFYLNITDNRNLVVSTEHIQR